MGVILGWRIWYLEAVRTREMAGLPEGLSYDYGLRGAFYDLDGRYRRPSSPRPEAWWPLDRWLRARCISCEEVGRDILACPEFRAESGGSQPGAGHCPGFFAFHPEAFGAMVDYVVENVGGIFGHRRVRGLSGAEDGWLVIGLVALAGRVHVHEYGYRAEWAKFHSLAGPAPGQVIRVTPELQIQTGAFPLDVLTVGLSDQQLASMESRFATGRLVWGLGR